MAEAQATSERTAVNTGRKPIRESPLLEHSRLARILRDLASENPKVRVNAAYQLRHEASKGGDISEAYPSLRATLASGERGTVENILWALKYAVSNGSDISTLIPSVQDLRFGGERTTGIIANLVLQEHAKKAAGG